MNVSIIDQRSHVCFGVHEKREWENRPEFLTILGIHKDVVGNNAEKSSLTGENDWKTHVWSETTPKTDNTHYYRYNVYVSTSLRINKTWKLFSDQLWPKTKISYPFKSLSLYFYTITLMLPRGEHQRVPNKLLWNLLKWLRSYRAVLNLLQRFFIS